MTTPEEHFHDSDCVVTMTINLVLDHEGAQRLVESIDSCIGITPYLQQFRDDLAAALEAMASHAAEHIANGQGT